MTGVLCDGLGHGPLAATAATTGVAAVLEEPRAEPAALVERAHRAMASTRGGAIGVVQLAGEVVRFAGLGNIAAVILADGTRRSMLSVPGIAGHQARTIRQFEYTAPPGATIILHSDGISSRWEPGALPGTERQGPAGRRRRAARRGRDTPRRRRRAGAQAMTDDEFATLHVRDLPGVFAARRLGRELAAGLGLEQQDQVRVATALSEICRSTITAGQTAVIVFGADDSSLVLTVTVDGEPPADGIVAVGPADGLRADQRKAHPDDQAAAAAHQPDMRALRERLTAMVPESSLEELRRQNQDLIAALDDVTRQKEQLAAAQRRAAGDQPRRDGPVQRAVGRTRADQPGRGRALQGA